MGHRIGGATGFLQLHEICRLIANSNGHPCGSTRETKVRHCSAKKQLSGIYSSPTERSNMSPTELERQVQDNRWLLLLITETCVLPHHDLGDGFENHGSISASGPLIGSPFSHVATGALTRSLRYVPMLQTVALQCDRI